MRKALIQFQEHYHEERNHQGKNNLLLFPAPAPLAPGRRRGIRCRVLAAHFGTTVAPIDILTKRAARLQVQLEMLQKLAESHAARSKQ